MQIKRLQQEDSKDERDKRLKENRDGSNKLYVAIEQQNLSNHIFSLLRIHAAIQEENEMKLFEVPLHPL